MKAMLSATWQNKVAQDLRELMPDVPDGWIEVFADEDSGIVAALALNMEIEEVGDAENGPSISASPTRFVYVVLLNGSYYAEAYDWGAEADHTGWGPKRTCRFWLGNDLSRVAQRLVDLTKLHPKYKIDRTA